MSRSTIYVNVYLSITDMTTSTPRPICNRIFVMSTVDGSMQLLRDLSHQAGCFYSLKHKFNLYLGKVESY